MLIKTFTKNKSKIYFNYNFNYSVEGLQVLKKHYSKLKKYDFKESKKIMLVIYNDNKQIKNKVIFKNPDKLKNYLKRSLLKIEGLQHEQKAD